ncbi:hypothetical protein LCGC14_1544190 [marine sediment metagenome]|uniref:Uncharacterized protein n=1 Tax=marine sediment metagenome TaxID=412755 RepID=A0A0F9LSY1_9ZZZZ
MNKKEVMKLLKSRIESCYDSLLNSRAEIFPELYIEGFRCRLDELLLLHHLIEGKTFVETCNELGIKYQDVNVQDAKRGGDEK